MVSNEARLIPRPVAVLAVGFDFDNTVADTLPLMCLAVDEVLRNAVPGAPACQLVDLESQTPLEFLHSRAGSLAKPNLYWRALVEHMTTLELFPKMREMLNNLQPRLSLGLQTSLPRTIVMKALRLLRIDSFFFRIIAFGDVSHPKPAPDGILALASDAAVSPREFLFVGDRAEDIQAARAARALSGLALWSRGNHRDGLAAGPTYGFRNPSDIIDLIYES
jgi:HAD superfamily hydrolase (TIGR01509 family)